MTLCFLYAICWSPCIAREAHNYTHVCLGGGGAVNTAADHTTVTVHVNSDDGHLHVQESCC